MNKRIQKRHDRQVARAKQRVRLSEPDLRTPEQVRAAREASRPSAGRRNDPHPHYAAKPSISKPAATDAGSAGKGEF